MVEVNKRNSAIIKVHRLSVYDVDEKRKMLGEWIRSAYFVGVLNNFGIVIFNRQVDQ